MSGLHGKRFCNLLYLPVYDIFSHHELGYQPYLCNAILILALEFHKQVKYAEKDDIFFLLPFGI